MACARCGSEGQEPRCRNCGCARAAGAFRVERVLGESGQSRTYLARAADGQRVFLKELVFSLAPDAAAIAAFEQEGELLKQLSHPDIPAYLAHFAEGEGVNLRLYLAERYLEGPSLLEELGQRQYEEAELQALAAQLLDVLSYLHQRTPPVLHRDLKPANLIRRPDGRVSVVDFGSARDAASRASQGLTQSGTVGYAPPEQLAGTASPASDVYALAATLRHLLTHKAPWEALPARWAPKSPAFAAWFRRALAPNPRNRFGSAQEAKAALTKAGRSLPRSLGTGARAGLAGVAVLASVAAVWHWWTPPRPRVHPRLVTELCPEGTTLAVADELNEACQVQVGEVFVRSGVATRAGWAGTERQLIQVAHYTDDLLDGPFERLNSSGKKQEAGLYVRGQREGPWVMPDGWEGLYSHGQRQGVWRQTLNDVLVRSQTWVDDQLDGLMVEYRNGVKTLEAELRAGKQHGRATAFTADGQVAGIDHFVNGVREGEHVDFGPGGREAVKGGYVNGEKHGVWITTFDKALIAQSEETWVFGTRTAVSTFGSAHEPITRWELDEHKLWRMVGYEVDGKKSYEISVERVDGSPPTFREKVTHYWPNGAKRSESFPRTVVPGEPPTKFTGPVLEWFDDGKLSLEGEVEEDLKVGLWKRFWPNRRLRSVQSFQRDKLTGESREYFENGQLKTLSNWDAGRQKGLWLEYSESGRLLKKQDLKEGK